MDIVIIANFCRDFSKTDNGRFMYLCKALTAEGHDVEIITSDFSHAQKKHKPPLKVVWPFRITFLHEPGYRRNVSLGRLVSHWAWGREVCQYLRERKKPDVVYCAVPSLTAASFAARFCERNNVRFIIDIQDLWPEAFQLALNMPVLGGIAFLPLRIIADRIYSRADEVCAVSRTYAQRAMRVNTRCQEPCVVYLGTDLVAFDRNVENNLVVKPDNELWIGYCGTLGTSYDVTIVIEALANLKLKGVNPPKLIVMGEGERREEFESLSRRLGVDAFFAGKLQYDQMCGMLAACDMAVNPIVHGAAQSIINKHGDYAAAGIPVLSTQESQEYRDLIDEYKMGFNCENNDIVDLSEKIKLLMQNQPLRSTMGAHARKCAVECFDRRHTYPQLIKLILDKADKM